MKKIYLFIYLITLCTVCSIVLIGCATIVGYGGTEEVNFQSTPNEANIIITDESGTKLFEGKTPTIIPLEKKKGYFSGKTYTVRLSKEGYKDQVTTINTKVNGWYTGGNCIFGGLLGWLIVDPLTGAMWTFDQNNINTTLELQKQSSLMKSNGMHVLLLQDVPSSLKDKMIKLTN